ncbi:hypothetical protein KBK19_01445 [Microvirga sp. STR05]|uniref:Uncharacterized protein n=1 Tax=Hymenobacter duratus TaxID=2771356 RepID=A0ABR8JAR5_9BACT|nr:hypothetical protein [Hymenobacter duratus]MBD2713692.1 hypothetical protein [Hymenobacter duratus]MBR7948594.1 hypothetical protein [Microvirga sp. STR05]
MSVALPHSSHITPLEGADTTTTPTAKPAAEREQVLVPITNTVYKVGDYLIGDADDAKLGGHPDIRY